MDLIAQLLIIVHTVEFDSPDVFQPGIFFPAPLDLLGDFLIIGSDREHIVKDIIACDNPAALRNPAWFTLII